MGSFNGSGYADKSTAEAYLDSYKYYKAWRKEENALELVKAHPIESMFFAEKFMDSRDPGHTPSDKNMNKFEAFKSRAGLLL